MNRMKKMAALFLCCLVFAGCGEKQQDVVRIADQYGTAYAPLVLIKEQGLLEQKGLQVEWVQLGNASAIREAMLADELDVGFMGIPPYLIGKDKGMEWSVFTGLTKAKLGLISNQGQIGDIGDILPDHRIALPQPGSIQHILLAMAAERELGDAKAFDNQLVSMNHPDGLQALRAKGSIQLQFTSPPYVSMALEEGFNLVLEGEQAFAGPFTFIVGVMSDTNLQNPDAIEILKETLHETILWMQAHPRETVEILSAYYDLSQEETRSYLYGDTLSFGTSIEGMETFESFMERAGYLQGEKE